MWFMVDSPPREYWFPGYLLGLVIYDLSVIVRLQVTACALHFFEHAVDERQVLVGPSHQ